MWNDLLSSGLILTIAVNKLLNLLEQDLWSELFGNISVICLQCPQLGLFFQTLVWIQTFPPKKVRKKSVFCPKSLDFYKMAKCYPFLETLGPGQCTINIFKIF